MYAHIVHCMSRVPSSSIVYIQQYTHVYSIVVLFLELFTNIFIYSSNWMYIDFYFPAVLFP